MMKSRRIGALLLAAVVGGYVLHRLGRRWGATGSETREMLPGDEAVPQPIVQTTHAVSIHAPAAAAWPWLVQMGYGRAGWYTNEWWYRLIDRYIWRVDMPRADRILLEFQHLALGDVVLDGPPGTAFWTVVRLEPERSLTLYSTTHGTVWLPRVLRDSSRLGIHAEVGWAFVLREPVQGQTRLILRTRVSGGPALYNMVAAVLLPPGDFVMARMMLRTIKRNAERTSVMRVRAPDAARPA